MTTNASERESFAERLCRALEMAGLPATPTKFAKAFNSLPGSDSITVHAARKWLLGEAIPKQNRIQALAEWIGVNAAWLRFGEGAVGLEGAGVVAGAPAAHELNLLADLRLLTPDGRKLVKEMVRLLLAAGQPFTTDTQQ